MFGRLASYSQVGAVAYKADLSNTLTLCQVAGHPEKKIRCIHIAGTNGKGSVSNMLASVFTQAGYKTGLYTSPHLKDFRERIRINGKMIPQEQVVHYYQMLIETSENIKASFFEMTTVMAFSYFANENVDIVILETGLGGRLDSTNVVIPDLSIITNISFDHQAILGNTLEKIACEKAGIIKPGVPVVIGRYQRATAPVFIKKAVQEKAAIYFSRDSHYNIELIDNLFFTINKTPLRMPLPAVYQIENLQTVLTALDIFSAHYPDIKMSKEVIFKGLENIFKNTHFQGRWQVIHSLPKVVLDVGHNEDGIKEIIEQLQNETYNQLRIIYGAVKEKEVEKIFAELPHYRVSYYLCEPPIERKYPLDKLSQKAEEFKLPVRHIISNPKIAYQTALQEASANDLILVTGSTFVVSEIL